MTWRTTVGLILVFAALCLAYWGVQQREKAAKQEAQWSKRLFSFSPDQVTSLSIHQFDAEKVTARRQEDGPWSMIAPDETIRPFQALWDRIALKFSELTNERTIQQTPQDDVYGLGTPILTVNARVEGKEDIAIAFGNLDPTQSYRYAQLDEGPVFLVHKDTFYELNRSLTDLRHRFLVNDREAPILKLEYARIWTGREEVPLANPPEIGTESAAITVERETPDSPWFMRSPVTARADQERVNKLIALIQFGEGGNFIDAPGPLTDYGLQPPSARITVVDAKTGHAQTLLLGDKDTREGGSGIFMKRVGENAVFVGTPEIVKAAPKGPNDFRDHRLITGSLNTASRIEYVSENAGFTLENSADKGWQMTRPAADMTDQAATSAFFSNLKRLSADSFPDGFLPEIDLSKPDIKISIYFDEQSEPVVLPFVIGEEEEHKVYATTDEGTPVELNSGILQGIYWQDTDFISRKLLRVPAREISEVQVQYDQTQYSFQYLNNKWIVREPQGYRLNNQGDINNLLLSLATLYAEGAEWKTEDGSIDDGLDTPKASVTITRTTENGQTEQYGPLKLGNIDPSNSQRRYAAMQGRTALFYVNQELMQLLQAVLNALEKAAG